MRYGRWLLLGLGWPISPLRKSKANTGQGGKKYKVLEHFEKRSKRMDADNSKNEWQLTIAARTMRSKLAGAMGSAAGFMYINGLHVSRYPHPEACTSGVVAEPSSRAGR